MFDLHPSLYTHFLQSWENFTHFCEHINVPHLSQNTLLFEGEGILTLESDYSKEKYYLFSLNNKLYGTRLVAQSNEPNVFEFKGVSAFSNDLLSLPIIKKPGNYYKKLDASIEVDCKPYDYGHEQRLLISKASKVDLLYSQQLNKENNNFSIKSQTYPSLKQAVDWQKKVNSINEKTAKILAEKQTAALNK